MKRLLRQEDGIALLVALGFVIVLTIVVSGMITYTSAGSRSSTLDRAQLMAQQLAEGGVGQAASILNITGTADAPNLLGCSVNPNNPSDKNSYDPCTPLSVKGVGGTTKFYGKYTYDTVTQTGTWTITSWGEVPNPTGGATVSKAVTAKMTLTGGGQTNNISVWNYVYSTGVNAGGCEVSQNGSGTIISVPIFVTGDLCLTADGSAIIENTANGGQPVDVRVLGRLVMGASNATVGTASAPITSGRVGNPDVSATSGCTSSINGVPHACTTADNWYVRSTGAYIAPSVPTTDFPGWYANASPGPNHPCDPALSPSPMLASTKLDSDTTMNGTTPTWDITGASYNCKTSTGELSWNATTKILTVNGTIFIDGNITSSSTAAKYHGKATLYVNGTFTMSAANASLRAGCPPSPNAITAACQFANVAKEWDPNKDNLLIITGKANADAINLTGSGVNVQAGFMCPGTSRAVLTGQPTTHEGAFICGKFLWGDGLTLLPLPSISNLPPGAPLPPNAPAQLSEPVITKTN